MLPQGQEQGDKSGSTLLRNTKLARVARRQGSAHIGSTAWWCGVGSRHTGAWRFL